MSTPTHITTVLLAAVITAAITYHLTRQRATTRHLTALTAAVRAARRDDLTGLGNRTGYRAALADAVARHQPAAVILINLDGSRAFVARFGHRAFDQLLVLTAGRVQHAATSAGAAVFRLRRDEFAVLTEEPAGAADLAATVMAAVAEPTDIHTAGMPVTVTVTACAGVAVYTPYADSDQRLALIRADRALGAAKHSGRSRTALFDPAVMRGPAPGTGQTR